MGKKKRKNKRDRRKQSKNTHPRIYINKNYNTMNTINTVEKISHIHENSNNENQEWLFLYGNMPEDTNHEIEQINEWAGWINYRL